MRNILCRGISLVGCGGRQVKLIQEMEENYSHTWKEVVWEDTGGDHVPCWPVPGCPRKGWGWGWIAAGHYHHRRCLQDRSVFKTHSALVVFFFFFNRLYF